MSESIIEFLKLPGSTIVVDEGDQMRLDGGTDRMYHIYKTGQDTSLLLTKETAESYGLRPKEDSPKAEQDAMFGTGKMF